MIMVMKKNEISINVFGLISKGASVSSKNLTKPAAEKGPPPSLLRLLEDIFFIPKTKVNFY